MGCKIGFGPGAGALLPHGAVAEQDQRRDVAVAQGPFAVLLIALAGWPVNSRARPAPHSALPAGRPRPMRFTAPQAGPSVRNGDSMGLFASWTS